MTKRLNEDLNVKGKFVSLRNLLPAFVYNHKYNVVGRKLFCILLNNNENFIR